ncbi:MAG: hypothetical protein CR997_05725 [Acidobacteria bacterium]|nr:MAG: hypothetical protein CR997_05725 [Acidobacteriota bacterium]
MKKKGTSHMNLISTSNQPMGSKVLAGDIGGTNARLALYQLKPDGLELVIQKSYPSSEMTSLEEVVAHFLESHQLTCDAACLGLPGPQSQPGVYNLTNLPWLVEAERLYPALQTRKLVLVNDVEASALGVLGVPADDLFCIHDGKPDPDGNRSVISVGTGLGVGILSPSGRASATESGHGTFAPQNDFDVALMKHLQKMFGHVSWERIASGSGLPYIHAFLVNEESRLTAAEIAKQSENNEACAKTLEKFLQYVGSVAGSIALTQMATGGVYFCGGVANKMFTPKRTSIIREAFLEKGRMKPILERMPLYIIKNENLAIIGAAQRALSLV